MGLRSGSELKAPGSKPTPGWGRGSRWIGDWKVSDATSNLHSSISTLHSPLSNQYRSKARLLIECVARIDDVDRRVGSG